MGYLGLHGNKLTHMDESFYATYNSGSLSMALWSRIIVDVWLLQSQHIDTEWSSLPWVNEYFLRNFYFVLFRIAVIVFNIIDQVNSVALSNQPTAHSSAKAKVNHHYN